MNPKNKKKAQIIVATVIVILYLLFRKKELEQQNTELKAELKLKDVSARPSDTSIDNSQSDELNQCQQQCP